MVHSTFAQGHVMGSREPGAHGGIPKSPSFHSGLDLAASASVDSLSALTISTPTTERLLLYSTEQQQPQQQQQQLQHHNQHQGRSPLSGIAKFVPGESIRNLYQRNGLPMSPHIILPLPNLSGCLLFLIELLCVDE